MSDGTITHVVVPGTFDPVTLGHVDVIRRTRRLFPRVTVAVAASVNKRGQGTTFTLDERVEMIREALALEGLPDDVEVAPFTGLLVAFAHEIGAGGIVKGLRAMTDFEYELQQADLNSHLSPDLESVFVMSSPQYGYVSSSIVREIASMGSDVSTLVPANVNERLRACYGR
ncbi:MAG: pantetheine-phosphate adenylyltransferase [Atopobiaceae bacterium]|nr:pantetheine-phosphate adenylyltransferase [Atopobiaceae bacterium]